MPPSVSCARPAWGQRVLHLDDQRLRPGLHQGEAHRGDEFAIDDSAPSPRHVEDVGMVAASRRVLMVFSTAPAIGTP